MGSLGWKTITGSILLAIGQALPVWAFDFPHVQDIGSALAAIGIALGGIGLRAAVAKIGGGNG